MTSVRASLGSALTVIARYPAWPLWRHSPEISPCEGRKGAGEGPGVDQGMGGAPKGVAPEYQIESSGALPPARAAGLVQPAVIPACVARPISASAGGGVSAR